MRCVLSSLLRSLENVLEFRGTRQVGVSVLIAVLLLGCQLVSAQAPSWTTKAPLPVKRDSFAIGVIDGILYAVGGEGPNPNGLLTTLDTLEAYDPNTDTWISKAPMPTPRHSLGVGVVDGILYAVGGSNFGTGSTSSSLLSTVEAYDPRTNNWTTKAPLPEPRGGPAIGVINGIIYAVGGATPGRATEIAEAYDPRTNTWTSLPPLPTRRGGLAAVAINGILYALGGGVTIRVNDTVEAYDPRMNTWTAKPPMPTARAGLAAVVMGGTLYAVGGNGPVGSGVYATVEAYDPVTDTWTTKEPMPTARTALAAGVVGSTLYAVGGANSNGSFALNEAFGPFFPQTITFPALSSRTYGEVFSISATATTGLTVAFTSTTPYVCVVSGTTVRLWEWELVQSPPAKAAT